VVMAEFVLVLFFLLTIYTKTSKQINKCKRNLKTI
jgi:hypothetical protein